MTVIFSELLQLTLLSSWKKLGNGTLRHLVLAFNILYQSLHVDWGRFLELTDAEASLSDNLLFPGRLW